MRSGILTSFLIATCVAVGYSQTLIRCRLCTRASTLSDCNKLAACDATLEDCYMDQIATDQATVVYNAGCRSKSLCAQSSNSTSVGKKSDTIGCSSCCNYGQDCNKRLCGIKDDTISSSQCYSCDHRSSEQSEIKDPRICVTLDTCQPNEVCYAKQSDVAGRDIFFYGCMNKQRCAILMQNAYTEYQMCVSNTTAIPPGQTWIGRCVNLRRSTSLCHSCCADGGCNHGSCEELNARIFKLAVQGKFDMKTLKVIP